MSRPIISTVGDIFPNTEEQYNAQDVRNAAMNISWTDSFDLIQTKIQVLHLLMLTDVILPKLEALERTAKSK